MKIRYLVPLLIILPLQGLAQNKGSDEFDQILKSYEAHSDQFMNLQGCGNILDGPAFIMKIGQNTTLDALLFMSESDEMEMGNDAFKEIQKREKILTSHWAKDQVQSILNNMVRYVDRKGIKYQIHIIDSEEINALAFIIGHEVSHIDKEHTVRKQKKLLLASAFADFMDMQHLTEIAVNIELMLNAPFDQIDEYEADEYGVSLAKRAGYDAKKFDSFFEKLSKYQDRNILNKLLSTHPFAADRKACIDGYIKTK